MDTRALTWPAKAREPLLSRLTLRHVVRVWEGGIWGIRRCGWSLSPALYTKAWASCTKPGCTRIPRPLAVAAASERKTLPNILEGKSKAGADTASGRGDERRALV
eukprot:scaffold907_cov398-Prasinococcus_capsulatus_cf.AAC.13